MKPTKNIVRDYYEKIVNTGNTQNIQKYISENYVEVYNGKVFEAGIEGARKHVKGVRKTYPDLHLEIENLIAEGDWVVTVYTMTGTHSGEWMGIKPTGKKFGSPV